MARRPGAPASRPAPAHLLSVRCVFTISHGRMKRGGAHPGHRPYQENCASSANNPPSHHIQLGDSSSQPTRLKCGVPAACLSHARSARARARTRSPRTRARTPSARTPPSPAPPALHPPAPRSTPNSLRAGFHASSDALLGAWRSRHSMMCIRGFAPPPPAQAFLCAPPPQALGASPLPCPPLAVPPWSRAKPTLVSSSPAARF